MEGGLVVLQANKVTINIADVVISVVVENGPGFWIREHAPFVCHAPLTRDGEVLIRGHYGGLPEAEVGDTVFDTGEMWALYRSGAGWLWRLFSPNWDPVPHRLALFSSNFCKGDVYFNWHPSPEQPLVYPLIHPLDHFLINSLLARGRGVNIHSCGVDDQGRGLLFAGMSGAGKTTISRLWHGVPGVKVLSDDRVIVRKRDGQFWMYGTPWAGDAGFASPTSVPLERIFVLAHTSQNSVADLKPPEVVADLLQRSFLTFWDAAGMEYSLGLLDELSHALPCHSLGFAPDRQIVDFVRNVL
jgi:hypothetical protein